MTAALKLIDSPVAKPKRVMVADLFCGAGGSSTGAQRALARLGMEMRLTAVNHWPVAIATHSKNHPEAVHYCQDIASLRPTVAVPEGRLDLLMASPTCTYHSRARGGRPTSDQQRQDPWQVITWLTELRVKRLLVENVPEFVQWGPVSAETGKPLKSRRGEYFQAWIQALQGLGYRVDWKILNAADFGDATTRERFFLQARCDGRPIRWPLPTHSREPGGLPGIGMTQKWRAAREIIDWDVKGRSIFDRKRPLSPKTLARIYAGAVKFRWPEPFLVILRNHMDAQGLDSPLPTITAGGTHIGLAQPFVLSQASGGAPRNVGEPLPTATTDGAHALVEPFVLSPASGGAPRSVDEPVPAIVAGTNGIAHSLIAPYYGSATTCTSTEQPLPTVTTKDRFGMVVPITHAGGGNRARSIDDPLPTITTAHRGEHAFIAAAFGERPGQAPRVHSVDAPVPTLCAQGRVQLVEGRGYDILFRMLEPHELAAAMGFSRDEARYEFSGTKTDIIKQIGNAVCVGMAEALVGAMFE